MRRRPSANGTVSYSAGFSGFKKHQKKIAALASANALFSIRSWLEPVESYFSALWCWA
jgi:hypothetical protein